MRTADSSSNTFRTRTPAALGAGIAPTSVLLATALVLTLGVPGTGEAVPPYQVICNTGGDQFGYSVATNGDFNGDGINDIAVGAPCHHIGISPRAGSVTVFSGANGRKLFRKKGGQPGEWYGAGVSFVHDINGDGRDELAVGAPGYDIVQKDIFSVPRGGLPNSGRVEIWQRNRRRYTVFGPNLRNGRNTGFGAEIAPLDDVNGDGKPDFAIASSHDRKANAGGRPGRIYVISGRTGDVLGFRVGPRNGKRYGRSLASIGDVDNDGLSDFLAGSADVNVFQVRRGGVVDVVSPVALDTELARATGAKGDGVGVSLDGAPDMNGDGVPDFIAGSDRSDDVDGIKKAGLVTLFAPRGPEEFPQRLWVRQDTAIQEFGYFGSAVATIGDMNHDGVVDFAAGALGQDVPGGERTRIDAGRVVALSGIDGSELWATNGEWQYQQFGFDIAGRVDWNQDHSGDVVVGSIGDRPVGRRGAGSVRLLSGEDGSELARFDGRRGLETRIVVAAPITANEGRVRTFRFDGRRAEMNTNAVDTGREAIGDMSVAILDDRGQPRPKQVQVAIAAGAGATSSKVDVFRMGRRRHFKDSFEAFGSFYNAPAIPDTGVNLAAGQVDGVFPEDLVAVQADSSDGNVELRVFRRLDEDQPFFLHDRFPIFANGEEFYDTNSKTFYLVNAGGATVAMGDVRGNSEEEIIVGTTSGVPMVKIFSRTGVLIEEFLAYPPEEFSGVNVAVGNLDGGGDLEIITGPRQGRAEVKVFNGNGARVTFGRFDVPIFIPVLPESFLGGVRVAAADVDLDDQQEIVTMITVPAVGRIIRVYERDNKQVIQKIFPTLEPFTDTDIEGGAIIGTDLFVRD